MSIPGFENEGVRTVFDYLSFTWMPVKMDSLRKTIRASCTDQINQMDPRVYAPFFSMERPCIGDEYQRLKTARQRHLDQMIQERYKETIELDLDKYDLYLTRDLLKFFDKISPLFGSSVELNERDRGVFGYKRSWEICFDGLPVGLAASGAKNGGCYVSLTGQGCSDLNPAAMYDQLKGLHAVRLTRVDIAYDDYQGDLGIYHCRDLYRAGRFNAGGRAPSYQYYEGGHLDFEGVGRGKLVPSAGRSFYVGKRANGKMLRVYEKGRQLIGKGEHVSPDNINWVRWELEIRNENREIPLNVLLKPTQYMANAYPALSFLVDDETADQTCTIKTRQKKTKITFDQLRDYARIGYGALVNVMKNSLEMSDSDIVQALISSNETAVPRRLERAMGVGAYAT